MKGGVVDEVKVRWPWEPRVRVYTIRRCSASWRSTRRSSSSVKNNSYFLFCFRFFRRRKTMCKPTISFYHRRILSKDPDCDHFWNLVSRGLPWSCSVASAFSLTQFASVPFLSHLYRSDLPLLYRFTVLPNIGFNPPTLAKMPHMTRGGVKLYQVCRQSRQIRLPRCVLPIIN